MHPDPSPPGAAIAALAPRPDHRFSRRRLLGGAAVALAGLALSRLARAEKNRGSSADIFARPTLLTVRLTLSADAQESLRKTPRQWVQAGATINGRDYLQVGLHLKSSTSFLPLDQKPSFTLGFNHFVSGQRFCGLRKVHLNNSVQDPTYLCEDLAGELFRRAGVPCARVVWAQTWLNDRPLGLHVLKEGFTREFLALFFAHTDGNLYDGGLHHDIFENLTLESGQGPQDCADLKALYAATQEANLPVRWQLVRKLVDLERFISMMAMESLSCHIDGYSLMQNNYRIYFEPPIGRAVFIAHGMDRMFEQPDYPVEPAMRAALSLAILAVPEGRLLYRRRLAELADKVLRADWMTARMEAVIKLLKPIQPVMEAPANALRQRVLARVDFVRKHLKNSSTRS